jgi:stage V sporulation protein S
MSEEISLIKVSGSSNPTSVASIVARSLVAGHSPKIRAVGASAVNQAIKALAIARGFVAPRGLDLQVIPAFDDIEGESGETISAIALIAVAR